MKRKNQKGIALLWTMIICLILLIVSGTIVGYIIKDNRQSIRIEDSVQAYSAAKSGLDWGLEYIKGNHTYPYDNSSSKFIVGGAEVTIKISPDLADPTKARLIESTGVVNGVQRKLLYNISNAPQIVHDIDVSGGFIDLTKPPAAAANTGSFKLQFDFWLGGADTNFQFGTVNSVDSNLRLALDVVQNDPSTGKRAYLYGQWGATQAEKVTSEPAIFLEPEGVDTTPAVPYYYRAVIKYNKNLQAVLEISRRVISGTPSVETYEPMGAVAIDLTGKDLGNQNYLYFNTPGTAIFHNPSTCSSDIEACGDGSVLELDENFIDRIVFEQ